MVPRKWTPSIPSRNCSDLTANPCRRSVKEKLQLTQRKRAGTLFGSPFKFRKHGESGLPISELFPHVAKHADDLCVVRSMQGEIANHSPGLLLTNCGHSTLARPSIGSWLLYGLGNESEDLPGFVVLCPSGMPTAQSRNWTSAFLPGIYQGNYILTEKREEGINSQPDVQADVSPDKQLAQVALTQFLNRQHRAQRPGRRAPGKPHSHAMELAFRMQTAATDVFDLAQEPQYIRDMYGDTTQGRNMLMARRLVERGVRYVQCFHGDRQPWDSHGKLVPRLKQLAQESDQPIAALLTDLKQRGLLEDTLVIWGGEMGRTPTIQNGSTNINSVGRDHHVDGYTIWMAGGGFRGGMTYGRTDDLAMRVEENPVLLHDLHATILHQMGFAHERLTYHYAGRDYRLTDVHGKVIKELIS